MRRSDICLYLGPTDRAELQALLTSRNAPRKLAWSKRAEDILTRERRALAALDEIRGNR